MKRPIPLPPYRFGVPQRTRRALEGLAVALAWLACVAVFAAVAWGFIDP